MATVGAVSNPDHMNITIGKAGRKRWMGRMPHNRGIAMNPVDHPHGGAHQGRRPSGHAVGLPDQGQEDPQEQVAPTKFIMLSRHARKKTS